MAMSLGDPDESDGGVIATINTTPLVDVMLVLLIIFLITIPVVTHTVPVKLPNEVNHPFETRPQNINLAINERGQIFWNQEYVPSTKVLFAKLKEAALMKPQPEVDIRGDQQVPYEFVGRAIFTAQRAGIAKLGFILEPSARGE